MKKIKICIKTTWCPELLKEIIEKNYECIHTTKGADYILFNDLTLRPPISYLSRKEQKIPIRIFYTGEAFVPDFNLCDYAISFEELDYGDRSFTIPLSDYSLYNQDRKKTDDIIGKNRRIPKVKFCNFIYSNSEAHACRDQFFYLLSKYKKVDSLGSHLKNVEIINPNKEREFESWYEESIDSKKPYKFSIAFENALHTGYTTEKILSSFLAGTIPLYWGNPNVAKYFNPKAFINCHDYKSFDEVIEKIKHLDNDHVAYMEMLNQPMMTENQWQERINREKKLEQFVVNIFNQPIETARRRGEGTFNAILERTLGLKISLYYLRRAIKRLAYRIVKKWFSWFSPKN